MKAPRTLLGVLVAAALFTTTTPFMAEATHGTIQPGDGVLMTDGSLCTLNYVYDGVGALAGRVFMGTAAHCVEAVGAGARVEHTDFGEFGTVVFIADEDEIDRDYAFIEVDDAFHDLVRADVRGHAGYPTGVAEPRETELGDPLVYSGWGFTFQASPVTRENRAGVLTYHDDSVYRAESLDIMGDSGGPVTLLGSKEALGIVSVLVVGGITNGGYGAWSEGPTVHGLLADAAAHGFTVEMRTAT